LDNLETLDTSGTQDTEVRQTKRNIQSRDSGNIRNTRQNIGQSRDTANIRNTRHRRKTKHSTI
jgi:hypothetical protein